MNSLFRRLHREQEGQTLYLVAVLLIGLLGMAALSIDMGVILHAQRELQASTDAAATGGAYFLPNACQAQLAAWYFSGVAASNFAPPASCTLPNLSTQTAGSNLYPDLPNVKMVSTFPYVGCASSSGAMSGSILPCSSPSNLSNIIEVEQQVTVYTYFAKVLGFPSVTLTAKAQSLERGSSAVPFNIQIILDTTASMQQGDSTCKGSTTLISPTKEDCAKIGVADMLSELSPCVSTTAASCSGTGEAQEVGLLIFPGLVSSTYDKYEYDCQKYALCPSGQTCAEPGISSYSSSTNYGVVGLSNDYKANDQSSTTLSPSSNLVNSVSSISCGSGTTSNYGLQDPGGEGTYYAGAILQAQSLLSSARQNVQNAIILLSDGAANSTDISTGLKSGQCSQAVTNAAAAAADGTWVYAVAYQSQKTGCTTDSAPYSNPCYSLQHVAISPGTYPNPDSTKFYSDNQSSCPSPSNPDVTDLPSIFTKLGMDFLTTRLIPWGSVTVTAPLAPPAS
jgi:hypothetical protein